MPDGSAALRRRKLWLIDRRDHWRERVSSALSAAGAEVRASGHYVYRPAPVGRSGGPDLVVLLCTAVTPAELEFVREVHAHGDDILVLVASLSPQTMRDLFLAGALDVTEMPVSSRELVELVAGASGNADAAREHKAAALAGL